jgi:L-seryl-tRNA(Ser) seleniumtransferase
MSHSVRQLPPLNAVLERRAVRGLASTLRREVLVQLAREALTEEREFLRKERSFEARYGKATPGRPELLRSVERRLLASASDLLRPKLARVVNATGVLLHTNLGRAQLGTEAAQELRRVATEPVALEIDVASGRRGSRHDRVARWLTLLTGAEDGLVVNNGAAALWLAVEGLASRRRAVISRGEQVAIGGSFRMPELLRTTRARIAEVGTTNKTSLSDYARELREGDVIVKVHPSNYRMEGFVEEVPIERLAELARDRGARLIFDAGSGSLYNFGKFGLEGEMPVREALRRGADVVTFSGDKLLGGPQAGLVVGRKDLIARLSRHPVMRALRCDKLILAALEATLRVYGTGDDAPDLPIFRQLRLSATALRARARDLKERLEKGLPSGWTARVERSAGAVGGGSFAELALPGFEVAIAGPTPRDAQRLHERLRQGEPAILARVAKDAVRLDVRTLAPSEIDLVGDRVREALAE